MREQKRIKWGLQQALEGHFAEESETCPSEACLNLNFIVFFFKLDSHETSLSVECVVENLGCATFQFFLPALHTRIFKSNAKRQKHSKKSLAGLFAHMMFYTLFSTGHEQALDNLFVFFLIHRSVTHMITSSQDLGC